MWKKAAIGKLGRRQGVYVKEMKKAEQFWHYSLLHRRDSIRAYPG